jgi:hypothetical protein
MSEISRYGREREGPGDADRAARSQEFSRRALLHAGWAVPVVLTLTPTAAFAQSAGQHVDEPHDDSPHVDAPHADVQHVDAPHGDTPHGDGTLHTDEHGDAVVGGHADHTDVVHFDSPPLHVDIHVDLDFHVDEAHVDSPHVDSPHVDTPHDDV